MGFSSYNLGMKTVRFTLLLMAMAIGSPAAATEVFHWVDENGVHHFSQTEPAADTPQVSTMTLEDTTPANYDPEEDIYGVQAQAERMQALREEMDEKREAYRERQAKAAQQQAVQYRRPYSYGRPLWYPPYYPRPPVEPQPPVIEPLETRILIPPGQSLPVPRPNG